ncbi:DUF3108 domain-containing protein [Candidatus Palauibacter sp.]|uniref:DUF3108 domain-containing protein n=1 Tax=Candidatus Palauibacter sp. TaxID=3101350 RepID=UPI003B5B8FF5
MSGRSLKLSAACVAILAVAVANAGSLVGQTERTVDDSSFPETWPFQVGEEAEYAVLFGRIQFGRMTLRVEAQDTIRGTPTHRLSMEIEGRIPLYRLDDRTVSWIASDPYRSLRFEEVLRQGSYRRHRRWELDHETLTATREDWDEEAEAYRPHRRQRDLPMPPGALDEISYLFLIRKLDFEIGRTYEFNRYFEEDGNPVVVEVLRRERVRVPAGTFETIVVRPIIQTDGLFGEDGQAEVFISDDDRRLIVQIKSRMLRGAVNMYLRESTSGEAETGG